MNREGFWRSSHTPLGREALPWPQPDNSSWPGRKDFLAKLSQIEEVASKVEYRGFSGCRLCKCINGSSEYQTRAWSWPSGYRHYIEEHNVRPSLAFEEWVTEKTIK
jgi:hypothetical protein